MDPPSGPRIVLVGASGWVGGSLGPAMLDQGVCEEADLVCVNRSGRSSRYAAWPGLRWETDVAAALPGTEVVILSVRPQDFRAAPFRCEGRLVLSLMAGVGSAELAHSTGADRIVRAMPNAAVEIRRCFAPWHATGPLDAGERALVTRILDAVGASVEVPREHDIDVLSALSGTGQAYPALLAEALLAAARAHGIDDAVAVRTVEAIVCDAAELLRGRVTETGALLEQFMDYRGVTAAGLTTARAAGFDEAVARAIAAGVRRAGESRW